MRHGDALGFARIRVVRMKLPALVDQIVIVGTIVTDEVTILVGGIIHTRSTVLKFFVHFIEVGQSVLLRIHPPIINVAVVVPPIVGTQVNVAGQSKIIKGHSQTSIRRQAVTICVKGHFKLAVGLGRHSGVDGVPAVVGAHVKAIVVRHVGQTRQRDDVFVLVDGPEMFRDLFNVLVKFLAVDTEELPVRVGVVAVEDTGGIVTKVFVVFVALVIGVDVLY